MSQREERSRLEVRTDALRRRVIWYLANKPYYFVSEFPKSGGSWLAQMLAAYFNVPFARNESIGLFDRKPRLLHGHHAYSPQYQNVVYVIRDGRDVMVSAYYYYLRKNERSATWSGKDKDKLKLQLGIEDVDDIEKNLPKFIRYMFEIYPRRLFRFSWADFTSGVLSHDTNVVRYEDLLADTPAALGKTIERLTGKTGDPERLREISERFSFANQAKRKPGIENTASFLRKGIAGDWKNKFTRESAELFDRYAGDVLLQAGYAADRKWLTEVNR